MKLDSEKQREILLNCIDSTQMSGVVIELMKVLKDVVDVRDAVEHAALDVREMNLVDLSSGGKVEVKVK